MDNAFPPLLSFFFASLPSFSVYHFLPVLALVLSCLVLSCLVLSCHVFCYFLILNSLKLWTHKKRLEFESSTLLPASSCASTSSKKWEFGSKRRHDRTRQDNTTQDKTRQDKTRQDKTRQDKTRQDETSLDKTRHAKTGEGKKRYDKTRQDKTRQDKARDDVVEAQQG